MAALFIMSSNCTKLTTNSNIIFVVVLFLFSFLSMCSIISLKVPMKRNFLLAHSKEVSK